MDDEEDHGTAQGGWKSEGLKENDSKDAYERRNKHKGGDRFGLAEETKRVLPGLDRAGLDVLRSACEGQELCVSGDVLRPVLPAESGRFPGTEGEGILGSSKYAGKCVAAQ